jgi:hypothetical protein
MWKNKKLIKILRRRSLFTGVEKEGEAYAGK